MITGQDDLDEGAMRIGETVKMAYVDQSRDALDNSKSVWEVISDGHDEIELGKRMVSSRAYVGQFNFKEVTSKTRWSAFGRGAQPGASCADAEIRL